MKRKHVVVDGSNIATEGRATPSLAQLDSAVRALLAEYPYEHTTVVVDATFGHRIDAKERKAFEEAVLEGELITPPAGDRCATPARTATRKVRSRRPRRRRSPSQ